MKPQIKYIFILLFSFATIVMFAQDTDNDEDDDGYPTKQKTFTGGPKQYFLFSPRVNVTVPHPIANSSFRKCFVGIYEVNAGLNIFLYKGLFIGGAYKNGLFKITGNKIANYNASMEINNASGKIGGDFYLGEKNKVIVSGSLSYGQNWTHYYSLIAKDPHKVITNTSFTCTYLEPEINIYFLVEDNFGVGATITYTILDHTFDPYELSLNDWAGFEKSSTGTTQYLSFGIGVYYSFLRKKK